MALMVQRYAGAAVADLGRGEIAVVVQERDLDRAVREPHAAFGPGASPGA